MSVRGSLISFTHSHRVSDLRECDAHPSNRSYETDVLFRLQSILEIQTLLVELVSNFEFSLNAKSEMVRRLPCAVMVPAVRGEEAMGVQMPLKLSLAPVN